MIYFILGVITAIFGIPVLQSLSELVCGKIEAMKMPDVEKVTKGNLDLQKLQENISDAVGYLELAIELNDTESFKEAQNICKDLDEKLEKLEIETLLSDEYDKSNAIVTNILVQVVPNLQTGL
jgi:hypothetical protein